MLMQGIDGEPLQWTMQELTLMYLTLWRQLKTLKLLKVQAKVTILFWLQFIKIRNRQMMIIESCLHPTMTILIPFRSWNHRVSYESMLRTKTAEPPWPSQLLKVTSMQSSIWLERRQTMRLEMRGTTMLSVMQRERVEAMSLSI